MKTLDIQAKEWFDKLNGNSYFSAIVTVDYSLPTEQTIKLPFQYGYGDQYKFEAFKELISQGLIKADYNHFSYWNYCAENNILLRSNKKEKCLQRDVKNFVK